MAGKSTGRHHLRRWIRADGFSSIRQSGRPADCGCFQCRWMRCSTHSYGLQFPPFCRFTKFPCRHTRYAAWFGNQNTIETPDSLSAGSEGLRCPIAKRPRRLECRVVTLRRKVGPTAFLRSFAFRGIARKSLSIWGRTRNLLEPCSDRTAGWPLGVLRTDPYRYEPKKRKSVRRSPRVPGGSVISACGCEKHERAATEYLHEGGTGLGHRSWAILSVKLIHTSFCSAPSFLRL